MRLLGRGKPLHHLSNTTECLRVHTSGRYRLPGVTQIGKITPIEESTLMNRRSFLSIACVVPLFSRIFCWHEGQPTRADPAPQGWRIVDREIIQGKERVIFQHPRLNILRIYLGGRYREEINFESIPGTLK